MDKSRQLALFDYSTLDHDTRSFVQTKTAEILSLVKPGILITIEIGQRLIEVKNRFETQNLSEPDSFIKEKEVEIDKLLRDAANNSIKLSKIAHSVYRILKYEKYTAWVLAENGLDMPVEFGNKALQVNEIYGDEINIKNIPSNKLLFISEGLLLPEDNGE